MNVGDIIKIHKYAESGYFYGVITGFNGYQDRAGNIDRIYRVRWNGTDKLINEIFCQLVTNPKEMHKAKLLLNGNAYLCLI